MRFADLIILGAIGLHESLAAVRIVYFGGLHSTLALVVGLLKWDGITLRDEMLRHRASQSSYLNDILVQTLQRI